MAANYRAGDRVRLVQPVIEGTVERVAITGEGNLGYVVRWTDAEGQEQHRTFDELALEAAPAEPEAPAA